MNFRELHVIGELEPGTVYKIRVQNYFQTAGCSGPVLSEASATLTFTTCGHQCAVCDKDTQICSACVDAAPEVLVIDTDMKTCSDGVRKCNSPADQYAKFESGCTTPCAFTCEPCQTCPVGSERKVRVCCAY